MDLVLDYALALIAALLLGVGFVLQQYAAEQEPESRFLSPRILTDLLRKPRWVAGIACMVAGMVLAAWAIGHLELSLVEPVLTLYLLFALLLAVPVSRQAFRWREIAGAVVLCAGVALLSSTRTAKPIGLSFGSFSHWPAAAIIAGVAFAAVQLGHRHTGQVRASLTGVGAGLVLGIQDALTRQTLDVLQGSSFTVLFSTWSAYALVGAGVVGVWLMQNAFSAAPLHASLPTIAAGEPAAGIVLGIVVFGDRIQVTPGMLAIEASGVAALIGGAIAVARSSAFGALRSIASHLPGLPEADAPQPEAPHADAPPAGTRPADVRPADVRPVDGLPAVMPPAVMPPAVVPRAGMRPAEASPASPDLPNEVPPDVARIHNPASRPAER